MMIMIMLMLMLMSSAEEAKRVLCEEQTSDKDNEKGEGPEKSPNLKIMNCFK